MKEIQVKNETFRLFLTEGKLRSLLYRVVDKLKKKKIEDPLFVGVLNGSFVFMADLVRAYGSKCTLDFIKVESYEGTSSSGTISDRFGLSRSVEGKTVVLIEDIIDSGETIKHVYKQMVDVGAERVIIVSLFIKPMMILDVNWFRNIQDDLIVGEALSKNAFILGYGLDYDGYGRELRDIYSLV